MPTVCQVWEGAINKRRALYPPRAYGHTHRDKACRIQPKLSRRALRPYCCYCLCHSRAFWLFLPPEDVSTCSARPCSKGLPCEKASLLSPPSEVWAPSPELPGHLPFPSVTSRIMLDGGSLVPASVPPPTESSLPRGRRWGRDELEGCTGVLVPLPTSCDFVQVNECLCLCFLICIMGTRTVTS